MVRARPLVAHRLAEYAADYLTGAALFAFGASLYTRRKIDG
jgi:hypothetical protein